MTAASNTHSIRPLRIGFLLSGAGRTLANLVRFLGERPGVGRVVRAISDRGGAFGIARAHRLGIAAQVLGAQGREADSAAIFASFEEAGADLVVLGGFLRLLRIPPAWERRVLNIHPALVPRFSGKGYYGDRIHAAVLAAGDRETGCTVHFVDDIYDHGPVLLVEKVPVLPGDTVQALSERVFAAECRVYPRAVEAIARGRVAWSGGKPRIEGEPAA